MNDPDSESQIIEGLPSNEIRRLQTRRGVFNDLWDDGIRLVREGVTTLEALENRINPIRVARAYRKADYTRPSTRSFNKQEGPMLDMEQA